MIYRIQFLEKEHHKHHPEVKKSERPVDALAVKKVNHSLTDNLKSRDASASKKRAPLH